MISRENIDWDAVGTLHSRFGYAIRTDPLWVLVTTAWQGHEGSHEYMWITMKTGERIAPAAIRVLALRSDRKRA